MDEKKIKDVLDSLIKKELVVFKEPLTELYPNLQAILMGTVSHPVNDWVGVRGELVKLVNKLDKAHKEIDDLKWANGCTVCLGTGKPISGKPCICGGGGKAADEVFGLREVVHAQERLLDKLNTASPHLADGEECKTCGRPHFYDT